jgi:type I restriction enzyme S subunit
MKYKAYPEYKKSGLSWVEEIPKDWGIKKLRFLGELDSSGVDKKIREDENLYKSVHYMDVYRNRLSEIGNSDEYLVISADETKAKKCLLKKGDVLFTNSSETPDDIGHSTVVKEDLEETLFGYHLMRFRPKYNFDHLYQKYLFGSDMLRSWFELRANGITRYGITYVDFADAQVILPPLPDQKIIGNFLDRETSKIASTINAKIKLIEKLKEKRNAIIFHIVTKGLDPNVKMQPSGIDWIGDIPEGWGIKKLKYVTTMKSGNSINVFSINENDEYPVYGGNGFRGYTSGYTHDGVYVLIGRQGALCGNVHLAKGKFWASEHAIVVTLKRNYDVMWLYLLLQSMNLNQYSESAAQPGLSVDRILNLSIPIPSFDQQTAIANYLNTEIVRIDNIIEKTQTSIEKLKEFQNALISAAVTGKIDVRGE